MGLQIRTYVNGNQEFIDLYGDETITLETSFAEIQDITKKNSAYTKEFKVPGTNNNNYIFNYFFEINSLYLTWNPQKKFEADLLYNGYEIANGYIRLNAVNIDIKEKIYSVTFYNGVGDVAANIGDKYLYDLDLSSLNHPYTFDCIRQSTLDPNLFPLTGTTNYAYQNGKTFFGLFNIGYNYGGSLVGGITATTAVDYTTTPLVQFPVVTGATVPNNDPRFFNYSGSTKSPVNDFYFKPAIQVKELYSQIFSQAGYFIDSEFFDTNYFEKFYVPLKFQNDSVYDANGFNVCYTFTDKNYPSNSGYTFNNCTTAQFVPINPGQNVSCNNVNLTYGVDPSGGFATYKINFPPEYSGDYFMTATITATFSNGCTSAAFDLGGIAFNVRIDNIPPTASTFTRTYKFNPILISSGAFEGSDNVLYLRGRGKFVINSIQLDLQSRVRYLQTGTTFDYALEFTDTQYKQIDFITSVNKMFNLVCVPHPTKSKTIIVEPIIDYIGKGEVLDWTEKVDYNSTITIVPTTNEINGTLNYQLNIDQDYPNQQFNNSNNRIFGTNKIQLNQDYKDRDITFASQFSPSIDLTLNANVAGDITIPTYPSLNVNNVNGTSLLTFKSIKVAPKIIFRGPVLPNNNWGFNDSTPTTPLQTWYAAQYNQLNVTQFDRWQSNNRYTTYPFSYSGFSHYINWNAGDSYDPLEFKFPNEQTLYDIYYYDYISDLTSAENKTMKVRMYLTPWEIAQLKFNEKIIIKNAYFRINKITNFNLLDPDLCDVELIKLTKDYTPHPVKYFDLISCSGGTDYHTTSDLNYNIFAYVGNYVNLFTGSTSAYTSIGCYHVVEGEPNGTYEYDKVFIASGYTTNGVAVYSDCGCSNRTSFNIVQQT